eukprot:COSAG04_NODE_90_length_26856_cov_18.273723_21_plen_289_part_00
MKCLVMQCRGVTGFELVNYLKKFILAGVLVFVEPGSASQLYVGLVVSFVFFALLCGTMPYRIGKTNRVAVAAEANLFFTMLCLLMLKLNLAGEWLAVGYFDTAIVASNAIAVVLPLAIGVVLSLRRLANEWLDSSQEYPCVGDVVRVLASPADPRCQDRLGKINTAADTDPSNPSPEPLTVVVNLPTTVDRLRVALFNRCRAPEKITLTIDRDQVQRVAGKVQTIRLLAGICTLCLVCGRAPRDGPTEQDAAHTGGNAHDRTPRAVHDAKAELKVEDAFDDDLDGAGM